MKDIWIEKFNFGKLIKKLIEENSRLSLPAYQREYSWDTDNWKELFDNIKELIKANKEKKEGKNSNIWFIGSIILQKKPNGNDYEIVDGQQRIITFFIILITIYSAIPNPVVDGIEVINEDKKNLLRFLFYDWYEGYVREKPLSLRIELDNHDDQIDLRRIVPFGNLPLIPNQTKERKRNIIKAENFYSSKIHTRNYPDIYQTILDNFYFSLITLDEETDSEIFMTLNIAGEDLTIPDLVKSLFTRRNDIQARKFAEIWEEKIVKKICFLPASKKNRSDKVKRFLIAFWEARVSNCYKRTWDDKIFLYYRKEIKGKNPEENSKFLDLLVRYAEVYVKIITVEKYYQTWWEQNWPSEMFQIISDIHLLDRKELFSLVLAIHFQFHEKTLEEKLIISKELRKLVIYIFRAIIIKKNTDNENALRTIRINTLKIINSGQISLFGQEKDPINRIIEEFRQGSDSFYQSLTEYQSKKDKELEIEKFILLTYYRKKIKDRELKINLSDYDIIHLVSQNFEIKEIGDSKNSLGNLTLIKTKNDYPLLSWDEKREIYRELGDDCLMNCLEEENWTEIEDIRDLIEKRKRYLIEDFKRLQIFEAD